MKNTEQRLATYALMEAAKTGDVCVASLALEAGADANWRAKGHGYTPLHAVCDARPRTDLSRPNQRLRIAKLLLDHGATVNALDYDLGITPLHLAVFAQLPEVIGLLLGHGADVNLCDPSLQKTKILASAMRTRDLRIVKMIIDAGADILELDHGLDALQLADMSFFGDQLRQVQMVIRSAFYGDDEESIPTGGVAHEA